MQDTSVMDVPDRIWQGLVVEVLGLAFASGAAWAYKRRSAILQKWRGPRTIRLTANDRIGLVDAATVVRHEHNARSTSVAAHQAKVIRRDR